jgi:single-stranded-DNA-specific exonuclease
LALIDADQQGLLVSYGGHAMAAGVTLRAEDFTVFARQFNAFVDEALEGKLTTNEIVSEGLVPTMDLGFAASLVRDHPWGQGFPEPLFDEQFEVLEQRRLKGGHLKLQLFSKRLGQAVDAIYFGRDQEVESYQARFAFRLDVNRYRGVDRVQLQIQNVWS